MEATGKSKHVGTGFEDLELAGNAPSENKRSFDFVSATSSLPQHPNNQQHKSRSRRGKNEAYAKAINSGSKEAGLQILTEEGLIGGHRRFKRISKNLDMIFQPPQVPWVSESPYSLSSFTNVPPVMQAWVDGYFSRDKAARPWRHFSIIIEGDHGTGKTMWARSLGKHNYLSGNSNLNYKIFGNDDAEYNVIDGVNPESLKYWKQLLGAKRDWQADVKYERPVSVKGGIPAIVLCNPGVGSSYIEYLSRPRNEGMKSWTLLNATFVVLQEPLFST